MGTNFERKPCNADGPKTIQPHKKAGEKVSMFFESFKETKKSILAAKLTVVLINEMKYSFATVNLQVIHKTGNSICI